MRFVTANFNFDKGGDREYMQYLARLAGNPSIICTQERGHGLESTRIRAIGIEAFRLPRIVVGNIGAHRGVAHGRIILNGVYTRILSLHGPHVGTVGQAAQDAYYDTLARKYTDRWQRRNKAYIIAGDFNRNGASAQRALGGTWYGDGVDGFLVSGHKVVASGKDTKGKEEGWTDHRAFWIDIPNTGKSAVRVDKISSMTENWLLDIEGLFS